MKNHELRTRFPAIAAYILSVVPSKNERVRWSQYSSIKATIMPTLDRTDRDELQHELVDRFGL